MAKQTFTAGQVLTAAEMNSLQENDYNWTVTTKTASYTLAAGDEGTRIVMNNAGATTITVDDSVFAAGDVVWLHNIGAGTCTVTAGTATVNTAASLDLAQWEGGSLYFTSASSAIFFRGPAAGVGNANFTDTATGTYSSGGTNYKYLTFTASGTITIDTDGLADILIIGGGGGGRTGGSEPQSSGGGAGGYQEITGAYLPVGTLTVTIGAGGAENTFGSTTRIDSYWMQGGGSGARNSLEGYGGSGGGGGANNQFNGLGVSGIGNDGGDGARSDPNRSGGGGGGAGGTGGNASAAVGGNGGAGTSSSITGSSVGRAGGGGGGSTGTAGTATDGGGNGGTSGTASAGTANTGGGGGGGHFSGGNGGAGGSGVVIVRVEV